MGVGGDQARGPTMTPGRRLFLKARPHRFWELRAKGAKFPSGRTGIMGGFSLWHWIVVGAIVLLLFGGKGKISDIMGDFAKGIKSFKKGLTEDDDVAKAPPVDDTGKTLDHSSPVTVEKATESRKAS
jgi:sec-independent protein translocase protein TatA